MRHMLPTLVMAAASLWPLGAEASGMSTARFGGEHGNPTANNPTAIYYNPAGLAESDGVQLYGDMLLLWRNATYDHDPHPSDLVEPPGAEGANRDEAKLLNLVAIPMLGASVKLGDFGVGAGFYVPTGGGSMWSQNERFEGNVEHPGAVDGSQRWLAMDGTMQLLYWTLAAGYQIPGTGLSLGVSGNLILSEIDSIQARSVAADNNIEDEGRSHIDVATWAGSFGVGVLYQPLENELWLGLSYQARPNVAGGHTLSGTLRNNFGSVDETPAELHQDMADIIRFGLRWRPDRRHELRLHFDWARWSAFEGQCISLEGQPCASAEQGETVSDPPPLQYWPRNWQDAVGLRLGASRWLRPDLELFVGAGYDGNAIPDAWLEPSLTDFEDFGFTFGGRFEIVEGHLHAAMSYTHFVNLPRDTGGDSDTSLPTDSWDRNPDAGGHYTEQAGFLNSNLQASF